MWRWYINPRAPIAGNEIAEFSLPQVGDAEAYVEEQMGSAPTLDQFLDAFEKISPLLDDPSTHEEFPENPLSNLCKDKKENGSDLFLQEVYCRAIVKKLSNILAQKNKASIKSETREKLINLVRQYNRKGMAAPEVFATLIEFDSTLTPLLQPFSF